MAYPTSCLCISVEVLCFFGVIILDVVLYEFTVLSKRGIQPFKRGFFCNDQSIMKPYESQSLTFAGLFSAGVVTSLAVIIIHEVGNHFTKPKHTREPIFKEKKQFGVAKIPTFIIRMLHRMALFITGFLAMLLFCDAVQLLTGRLRPHFLAVCKPNATLFNCSTGYITADVCTGDPLKIKYARLSFPSIHTASTAYSLVFIAICLQAIVYLRTLKIFRLLLQAVMFLLAIAVGLSRIKDNYHHWSDVVAGALIGTFTAWLVVCNGLNSFFPSLAHYNDHHEYYHKRVCDVKAARFVGVHISSILTWNFHVDSSVAKQARDSMSYGYSNALVLHRLITVPFIVPLCGLSWNIFAKFGASLFPTS